MKKDRKRKLEASFHQSSSCEVSDDLIWGVNSVTSHSIDSTGQTLATSIGISDTVDYCPPLLPSPLEEPSIRKEEEEEDVETEGNENEESVTQTAKVISEFLGKRDTLCDLILEAFGNPNKHLNCRCGSGLRRLVKCAADGCFQRDTSCSSCFLRSHRTLPFHWVLVWDEKQEHWRKRDYSELSDNAAIQLGHLGEDRLCSGTKSSIPFMITHTNGIHSTRIRFCGCLGAEDRFVQLVRSGLFPASVNEPRSAFTFSVLTEFSMHNLQSKCGAFDYVFSLRRLTDDVFTSKVPNPYKSFLRVTRVWDSIQIALKSGQEHGIDRLLPGRPKSNLNLYCPACPEPGVNMPMYVSPLPDNLRHLRALFLTIDGNHHANRYKKNTDKNDKTLFSGSAYFPKTHEYEDYLEPIEVNKEKSVCNYISAVNAQDRKKFKGMDITGIINVQCRHVFVYSSVDMMLGERFAYTDYALYRALSSRPMTNIFLDISYDSACSYSVNIVKRFRDCPPLPAMKHLVEHARFSIDALHINDHIDRCMYLFGASYQVGTGHFHGVGVEQYWAENNQMGPQTRQMNHEHRHEKISSHHSDWNWKKLTRIAPTLIVELQNAWVLYIAKREYFRKLSEINFKNVPKWYTSSKDTRIESNGAIDSVYNHSKAKAISLETVLKSLLSSRTPPSAPPKNPEAHSAFFVSEGISIQAKQISLHQLIKEYDHHPLQALAKEIEQSRGDLRATLKVWREMQSAHMSGVPEERLGREPCEVQDEILFLPSQFSDVERKHYHLEKLAKEEAMLREGQASENILQLRFIMKTLSTFTKYKQKNMRGQKSNTRSAHQVQKVELARDTTLAIYNSSLDALLSLGCWSEEADRERYPRLSLDDLVRKSTQNKRQLGDTYRPDGRLWILGEVSSIPSPSAGKLWSPITGLTPEDVRKWEEEEDSVQWFRAWAEMMRWLEEFELKHVEMARCILSFDRMRSVWDTLATSSQNQGYAGFARSIASKYHQLHENARELLLVKGAPPLRNIEESTIVEIVQTFRKEELHWLDSLANIMPGYA